MGTSRVGKDVEVSMQQLHFIEEYLKDPKHNGTQAAIKAGYSARSASVQSARMLGRANIKVVIKKREKEIEARTKQTLDIDRFWILRELKAIVTKKNTRDADKIAALKLLGLSFGMWKEKIDLSASEPINVNHTHSGEVKIDDSISRTQEVYEILRAAGGIEASAHPGSQAKAH